MQHSYLNLYKSRGVVPSITEEDYNEIHNKEGVNNMNVLERIKTNDFNKRLSLSLKPFTVDREGYHTESYISDKEAEQELIKLADIGQLALQTTICYWGYYYADGDCQESKCERNELCKKRDELIPQPIEEEYI